uniref:Uncharacterized protein n=1 Tax=Romanomermis culicivorax TaxID=13658 RepID=A0A915J3U3_ROMCU
MISSQRFVFHFGRSVGHQISTVGNFGKRDDVTDGFSFEQQRNKSHRPVKITENPSPTEILCRHVVRCNSDHFLNNQPPKFETYFDFACHHIAIDVFGWSFYDLTFNFDDAFGVQIYTRSKMLEKCLNASANQTGPRYQNSSPLGAEQVTLASLLIFSPNSGKLSFKSPELTRKCRLDRYYYENRLKLADLFVYAYRNSKG